MLIAGLSPLKIYLYKEEMVRFATEEYILEKNHLNELYRHLTNVYYKNHNIIPVAIIGPEKLFIKNAEIYKSKN